MTRGFTLNLDCSQASLFYFDPVDSQVISNDTIFDLLYDMTAVLL